MSCACLQAASPKDSGTLKCFLVAEDHLWIVTAWHLCLECNRVWTDDEENGWKESSFETLQHPNIWVTGLLGIYPETHLTDIETFAAWVRKLEKPYHTNPMV